MRVLSAVLAISLLWQHAVIATAQVVLCCQQAPLSAENEDEAICRCVHGPDMVCPMHHASPAAKESSDSSQPRWCAGCTEQTAVLSIVASGDFGTPPLEPFRTVIPPRVSSVASGAPLPPLDASNPPILPPPKA